MMRRTRRGWLRNDDGVTEVVGFVLSFALSAIFLLISLNTFFGARNNSDDLVTAAELKSIADRVAERIVEAGFIGQEFQNATLNVTVNIPQTLNNHPYYVEARPWGVYVNTTDLPLSAQATTFKLEAVRDLDVSGRVYSGGERLVVTYSLKPYGQGGGSSIHIHEES